MKEFLDKLFEFFLYRSEKPTYVLIDVVDLPDTLDENKVYYVGEKNKKWVAVFICPCGCSAIIKLNLIAGCRPRWKVKIRSKRKFKLVPSIWRKIGCQSHFHIINGNVLWH